MTIPRWIFEWRESRLICRCIRCRGAKYFSMALPSLDRCMVHLVTFLEDNMTTFEKIAMYRPCGTGSISPPLFSAFAIRPTTSPARITLHLHYRSCIQSTAVVRTPFRTVFDIFSLHLRRIHIVLHGRAVGLQRFSWSSAYLCALDPEQDCRN